MTIIKKNSVTEIQMAWKNLNDQSEAIKIASNFLHDIDKSDKHKILTILGDFTKSPSIVFHEKNKAEAISKLTELVNEICLNNNSIDKDSIHKTVNALVDVANNDHENKNSNEDLNKNSKLNSFLFNQNINTNYDLKTCKPDFSTVNNIRRSNNKYPNELINNLKKNNPNQSLISTLCFKLRAFTEVEEQQLIAKSILDGKIKEPITLKYISENLDVFSDKSARESIVAAISSGVFKDFPNAYNFILENWGIKLK